MLTAEDIRNAAARLETANAQLRLTWEFIEVIRENEGLDALAVEVAREVRETKWWPHNGPLPRRDECDEVGNRLRHAIEWDGLEGGRVAAAALRGLLDMVAWPEVANVYLRGMEGGHWEWRRIG